MPPPIKRKHKICLLFGLATLLLLTVLYWLNVTTLKESYDNLNDDAHMRAQAKQIAYLELKAQPTLIEQIQLASYNQYVNSGDKIIFNNQKNTLNVLEGDYALTDIVDDIMQGTAADTDTSAAGKIDWNNVNVDDTDVDKTNLIQILPRPQKISSGDKSVLNSVFKDDICEKYAGNNVALDVKCSEMTDETCKMLSCCVLLKGNKCVAGDANGPIFLTGHGKAADQAYYYHKNQCYGNCALAASYQAACSAYTPNSTGVSKECMVKIFNNAGCPNQSPDGLIYPAMVESYSQTTKYYVDAYIRTAVNVLKDKNNAASKLLCYGA